MALIPKFGFVYKGAQQYWAQDKAFFRSIKPAGTKFPIRISSVYSPVPWVQGDPAVSNSNAYWRECARFFATKTNGDPDPDFYVTWGVAGTYEMLGTSLNSTIWDNFRQVTFDECSYLITQNIPLGDYAIGNELESKNNAGAGFSIANLSIFIPQIATDVKALTGWTSKNIKVTYPATSGGTMYTSFVANGKGGLDLITHHPYGGYAYNANLNGKNNYYYSTPGSFGAGGTFPYDRPGAFQNESYISEWNITANNIAITYLKAEDIIAFMPQAIINLKAQNPSYSMFYEIVDDHTPRTPINLSDLGFCLYDRVTGRMSPMWDFFFDDSVKLPTPRPAPTNSTHPTRTYVNRASAVRPILD